MGLGTLAGLVLVSWRAPQKERVRYLDAAILCLFGALVGSRIAAVGANWAYYGDHIAETFQVWKGGISGIGALVGGMLAVAIVSVSWRIPVGKLADAMLPLAGTIAVAAWMGCWLGGCSYGMASSSWWAITVRDELGVTVKRFPVQLAGALLTLMLVWGLDWASRFLPIRGMGAAIGLFGLSAVVFGLSYLRSDPMPVWRGLRLDAWGALGLMVFSCFVVVVLLSWRIAKAKRS